MHLVPVRAQRRRRRALLRGLLERHDLAAVPRRHRRAPLPPRLVGGLLSGSIAGSRMPPPRSPPRARPSGCRTTSCSSCRSMLRELAPRPDHRLLPPHSLPGIRPLLAAAVAAPGARGPARRRRHRIPARGGCRQLRAGRAPAAALRDEGVGHHACPNARRHQPRSRSRKAFPISIDASSYIELAQRADVQARAARDPREPRQPEAHPARRRPARLHQGHPPPAEGVRRAARRRQARRSRT